jgi:hypothetical protein
MMIRLWPAAVLAGLLLLAGCDAERPGTWRATGVNDANLGLMLAHPSHAQRGVAASGERGQPASTAIQRLERGLRPALPESRASAIGAAAAPPPAPIPEATNGR